jgi:predicted peptidase
MKLVLRLPYYLYPNETNSSAPILLFLHGVGEGYSNNGQIGHRNLTQQGPPKYLESLPSPALPPLHPILGLNVVAPQLPDRETLWSDVVADLKEILARHRPDAGKLYIMGFSKGGLGAFQVAAQLKADALVAIDASPMAQPPREAFSEWVSPLKQPFWAIHTRYAPDEKFRKIQEFNELLTENVHHHGVSSPPRGLKQPMAVIPECASRQGHTH